MRGGRERRGNFEKLETQGRKKRMRKRREKRKMRRTGDKDKKKKKRWKIGFQQRAKMKYIKNM